MKLSVNETKWRSLLARTRALILYISFWIFDFEPVKLPWRSRNGPQSLLAAKCMVWRTHRKQAWQARAKQIVKNYLRSLIARVCCYLSWGEHANDVANDQLCKLLESEIGFRTFPAFQPYLARQREVSRIRQLVPEMAYEICRKGRLVKGKECRRHIWKREGPGNEVDSEFSWQMLHFNWKR